MIRLDMDFPKEFVSVYNKFNATSKGKELLRLTGISRDKLDIATISKQFFEGSVTDCSVDANSNVGNLKNLNIFNSETTKGLLKLDGLFLIWKYLNKKFGKDISSELTSKIIDGKYYFHDLTKINCPYCIGISTSPIVYEGRPYGNLKSKPPKRASSYINQCIEHLMTLSQEFAGAIALGDLIVNYSWYINKEFNGALETNNLKEKVKNKIYKKIENDFQSFTHVANNSFRIGGDSPFSNISLYCKKTLMNMFGNYNYPDGTSPKDIIETIMQIQYILMKFISKKDPISKLPYRFPICTLNLFVDKETKEVYDKEFLDKVSEFNSEGIFNIFITSDKAKIAMCCRLTPNKTDLMKFKGIDSFGNGGLNIGSHRVVTINLPRVARKSKSLDEFIRKVKTSMKDASKILFCHRALIKDRIEQNFLKFFKPLKWFDLDKMFFSTIGMLGIYESFELLSINILDDQKDVIYFLEEINHKLNKISQEYGFPFNLEQIPAEGSAVTLAKKDKVYFGDNPYTLYSNQFIPLWIDCDLVKRSEIDGKLSSYFGGGVISHLNISSITSKNQMKKLISFATKSGLDHFALNLCFSKCENNHTVITNGDICPKCQSNIVEKVTRVVGFMTPISDWTKERRDFEFPKRKFKDLKFE